MPQTPISSDNSVSVIRRGPGATALPEIAQPEKWLAFARRIRAPGEPETTALDLLPSTPYPRTHSPRAQPTAIDIQPPISDPRPPL